METCVEKSKTLGIGVGIIVLNEKQEVLLLLRNSDAALADSAMHLEGTYTLPSGKVIFGETFEEAAKRKLKDETNFEVNIQDLQLISLANDVNEYAHFATIGFLAAQYRDEFKLKSSKEFTDYNWYPLESLPKNICEPSQKIIKNYLNKTIY